MNETVLRAHTQSFMCAMTLKSVETGNHLPRVALLALAFGRALQLNTEELHDLKYGSLLHDLGKIAVPDSILHKPGRLDEREWEILREHPWRGAAVLRSLSFPAEACAIVEQHHERWDGTGYPFGLRDTGISKLARVFQIADCYDAITSARCYRPANTHEVAMEEILSWAGTQFDPELSRGFAALPETYLTA
jgi:putative nucleotidyltransferase with HDIG domain